MELRQHDQVLVRSEKQYRMCPVNVCINQCMSGEVRSKCPATDSRDSSFVILAPSSHADNMNTASSSRSDVSASSVQHLTIDAGRAGQRLDNFLLQHLHRHIPRSLVYRLIRSGQVRINGGRRKPMYKLQQGDQVRIPPVRRLPPGEVDIAPQLLQQVRAAILYRDADQMVVDKPTGLAVHAGSGVSFGLVDVLKQLLPKHPELALAHRLDRDTSGCVLVGLNRPALVQQQLGLKQQRLRKKYLLLVVGVPAEAALEVDLPLAKHAAGERSKMYVNEHGKQALTRFRLLQRYGDYSLLQAEPVTGRTHQIRVHALAAGMPLAGDRLYVAADEHARSLQQRLSRLFLHASELHLQWPQEIIVHAPLPEPLRAFLDQL